MARHRQGMGWGKFKRRKRWGIDPEIAQAMVNIERKRVGLSPISLADRSLSDEVENEPEKEKEVQTPEVDKG